MATVSSFYSNSNKAVANQVIVKFTDGDNDIEQFFSYETLIAEVVYSRGKRDTYLSETYYDYSNTTMKYLGQFLNVDTGIKQIRENIRLGMYVTVSSERDTDRLIVCETAQNHKVAA